ncbi:MAG: NAD(P)/FAD-dependent oxidoreductase [Actinobacteria bacterium]|nr:NAD(P)/FAD-dependent oxidoreductase [Actinomycetota bacterium]
MSTESSHDVVVIGGGHNGLLASIYLARAGFDVLLAERNEEVGGAIASGEPISPGFVHDLYATNMNLFLGSPAFADLGADLIAQGLSLATTSRPYSCAFPGGASLRVYQDRDRTREGIAAHDPLDAEGWDRLAAAYDRFAPSLFEFYGTPLPSVAAAKWLAGAAKKHGVSGLGEVGQIILSSTRQLGDAYFHSEEMKAMLAAWGMHIDFAPDATFGGLFPLLESFADMDNGMSVVQGGAGGLAQALAAVARNAGAEIRTASPVESIIVENGAAAGVVLTGGERVRARRAVIANLTPAPLVRLLPEDSATASTRRRLATYSYGPGTMVIHVALNGTIPWAAGGDLDQFGYVHIGPYLRQMSQTYTDAVNGILPADPLLVVGQTSATDPTRAPEGSSVIWIQVRMLPATIVGDARGEIEARDWKRAKDAYGERVLEKVESYAPGFRERIIGSQVVAPDDLEAANPNLVGGDSVGGSHHLSQNLLFRPAPGISNYRMPLPGLIMVGAATWPGAGLNAISGRLAAQELIAGDSVPRKLLKLSDSVKRATSDFRNRRR